MAFVKEQRKLRSLAPPFPRLLRVMPKKVILYSFSKEGTFPLNLLLFKTRSYRFEALEIGLGIDPINWLLAMLNLAIFGRVKPMFDGRLSCIWLSPLPKIFKEDKLKIEGGIVPDNLFEDEVKDESLVN